MIQICNYSCSYKAISFTSVHQFSLAVILVWFFFNHHQKINLFATLWANVIHLKNNFQSEIPKNNHTAIVFWA